MSVYRGSSFVRWWAPINLIAVCGFIPLFNHNRFQLSIFRYLYHRGQGCKGIGKWVPRPWEIGERYFIELPYELVKVLPIGYELFVPCSPISIGLTDNQQGVSNHLQTFDWKALVLLSDQRCLVFQEFLIGAWETQRRCQWNSFQTMSWSKSFLCLRNGIKPKIEKANPHSWIPKRMNRFSTNYMNNRKTGPLTDLWTYHSLSSMLVP